MANAPFGELDFLSIFNTCLGLQNVGLNSHQREEQDDMKDRIVRVESKLDEILTLLKEGNNV